MCETVTTVSESLITAPGAPPIQHQLCFSGRAQAPLQNYNIPCTKFRYTNKKSQKSLLSLFISILSLSLHRNCIELYLFMEKVVLTGVIGFEDLPQYDDLVLQPDVKQIDISDFSIKESEEDNWRYTYLWEETKPSLLATLVMNKDFSSIFVIDGSNVYSADKKTIVYSFNENAINIPEGTENIGMYAFCNNKTKKVNIPDGVKSIGELAFYMCENLISIDIPDSVETLGVAAFSMCNLEKVKLSNNLKEIPNGCFEYNNIEEITIPSSVKRIGSESFHCNFLNKVILPEGVESIGWNVFTHCNDYIYFPSTMREIEKDFFYEDPIDDPEDCVPFIEVSANNQIFFSKEGTLYKYNNPDEPYLGYPFKPKDKLTHR